MGSILYIQEVPPDGGGDTMFANMYLAYESLSEPLRKMLDGLTAIHDSWKAHAGRKPGEGSDMQFPRFEHPVVRVHPVTRRKLLFVDRYYLVFALGLCALTGIAVQRLGARSVAGAVAGVALAAMGALYAFDSDYYTADWPGVAGVLKARAQTGDLIVFDQGSPYFALNRLHALDGHPLILVFRRADVAHIPKLARPFHRVWLVLFQSGPVDPQARILHDLAAVYHPAGYWEYLRRLPAEGASIVLFVR